MKDISLKAERPTGALDQCLDRFHAEHDRSLPAGLCAWAGTLYDEYHPCALTYMHYRVATEKIVAG